MKVLVTGHDGYIGTVLVPMFQQAGHDVKTYDPNVASTAKTLGALAKQLDALGVGDDDPPRPERRLPEGHGLVSSSSRIATTEWTNFTTARKTSWNV